MFIPAFRNLRIRAKLVTVTLFLVLVPLVSVSVLSSDRFGKAIRKAAEEDLDHLVRNIYSMCQVQQEMVQAKLNSDLKVAWDVIFRQGKRITVVPEELIPFDAVNQFTEEKIQLSVPLWKVGDVPLTNNNRIVDEVQRLVGGACTIFQRVEGDRFLRIATNVTGKDGKSGVGTFIPPGSTVADTLLSGNSYRGRAYVVDDWYITSYEPIRRPEDGAVMGAIFVGVRELSAHSMKGQIKDIKVGETGYVYIMDSDGFLKIHPAKEGENIIDAKDTSGFEYIQAIIKDVISHPDGVVGTIRYPWANPELGETKPRPKVNKYIYFRPWDWIIVAGTYEEEIYQSLYETQRFIVLLVLIGTALVFLLTMTLSKVLTNPIRELTEVTTRMVGGDLSQRVNVHGADEIGLLGTSFNRMISQIQHYTANLEQMVKARTQELEESKEKYRNLSRFLNSILDSATEYAILALDFHGNIIEFNKGAEKLFGWKKEELVDKENISVTILPSDLQRGMQAEMSKRTRVEGLCELEMVRLRKSGEAFPAQTTVTAIKDPSGKTTGFVEIIRDITIRKQLEKELRETKEFLENIMESSVDGILTTDLKGIITYQNKAMEEMLEYPREEVLGTHISSLYKRGMTQAREVMDLLWTCERAKNYEMEVLAKDSRVLIILTSLFLLKNENQVIGTAGIFKDITEQKSLEAQLKSAQANLVEASKMRALGELVAGVAHEVNNPLMASQTILHVILKKMPLDFPERSRLELISKCNDRIERIVNHLREFSRQTNPEFEDVDINQPIENALLITGQQLLDHGISIERHLSKDLPSVSGNSSQLEQVFLNLISNARDAIDDSASSRKELIITSGLVRDNGTSSVEVRVKDTGVGIPPDKLNKIFEPFFSTKPVGKGTGLGLSLCFGIIEAHKGRIEINSRPGEGTEVKVLIPAIEAARKEKADVQTNPGGG